LRERVTHWLAWWIALVLLWQLFVNTFAGAEVVAGLAAAAVAATAAEVVRGQGLVHFRPRARWLPRTRALPPAVLQDSLTLARMLWRRIVARESVSGEFSTVSFESGGDDPESAARRALYVAAISLTPNTYVLGIDRDENVMLVHQLVPTHPAHASELVTPK
jgi:multisubunit Na+/H+ antiporter MnhE subunit